MAGTIPRFFCGVPVYNASEVRTYSGALVQGPFAVPVGGDLHETIPDQRTRAGRDLTDRIYVRAGGVIAILSHDVEIFFSEIRRCPQRNARWIVNGFPFIWPAGDKIGEQNARDRAVRHSVPGISCSHI